MQVNKERGRGKAWWLLIVWTPLPPFTNGAGSMESSKYWIMRGLKKFNISGWVRHNVKVDLKIGGWGVVYSKVILVPQKMLSKTLNLKMAVWKLPVEGATLKNTCKLPWVFASAVQRIRVQLSITFLKSVNFSLLLRVRFCLTNFRRSLHWKLFVSHVLFI